MARIGVSLFMTTSDTDEQKIEVNGSLSDIHVLKIAHGNPYGVDVFLNDYNLNRLIDILTEYVGSSHKSTGKGKYP